MNNQYTSEQIYKILPQLKISPQGVFKYILIKCKVNGQQKAIFVRGDLRFEYHSQNYDEFFKQLKKSGFTQLKKKQQIIIGKRDNNKFQFICPGGGRIQHSNKLKKCSIYGYSQSYGYVDHSEAQKIIAKELGYEQKQIKLNQKEY